MIEYDIVNVPIVDIVNQIMLYASRVRASDIHMDPHEDSLLIRMRIDGELRNHTEIPKAYERNLITRVKLISNMNITETRLPQDGAIKAHIEDRDLDMRVSVLPTNEGEKVVIRILDYSKSLDGINSLGFSEKNFKLLTQMLGVPNGIILVTGATGSGKSTTTYSMLQALNKENINIITVEDPVEMNIEGINQVQVNSEIGLTFAAALRSILRQDPNVILIGEIRDSETAQIAVRASITGHLVFSTLHTNNSLNTIERLLDMDVERYLLSSALTGIISQKLARKLCHSCRTVRETTEYEKEIFRLVLNKEVNQIYEAVGCSECTEGYRGRIALQEVLYVNDSLRSTIANPKTTKEQLKELVYTDEVTTLLGDGLEKIILGETTFKELFKLIEVDLEIDTLKKDAEKKMMREMSNSISVATIPITENNTFKQENSNVTENIPENSEIIEEIIDEEKIDVSNEPQAQIANTEQSSEIPLESLQQENELIAEQQNNANSSPVIESVNNDANNVNQLFAQVSAEQNSINTNEAEELIEDDNNTNQVLFNNLTDVVPDKIHVDEVYQNLTNDGNNTNSNNLFDLNEKKEDEKYFDDFQF